jgi:MFS family permease
VDNINLLFVFHALGGMLLADRFGRLGDRVGLRPVIIMCVLLKSAIVLAFLFSRPGWRVLVLLPFFTLDNMINTGLLTSHSTYMLKFSPRNNRTMYVAAVLATSGLAGAAASLSSGLLLQCLRDQTWRFLGEEWNHFHAVFAVGVALRLLAIPVATIIKEPKSQPADKVITEIVGPAVLRRLVLPVEYLWPFGK